MSVITYFEPNFGQVRETITVRIPRNTLITNSFKISLIAEKVYKVTANSFIDLFDPVVTARRTNGLF